MPLADAALFGCPVMTGVGAVVNMARIRAGDSVVVASRGGVLTFQPVFSFTDRQDTEVYQ